MKVTRTTPLPNHVPCALACFTYLLERICCTAALVAGGSESDSARAAASAAGYAAIDRKRPPRDVGTLAAHAAKQAGGDVEMAARAAGFFAGLGKYMF